MAVSAESAALLRAMFPSHLKTDVDAVLARLPPSDFDGQQLEPPVLVRGEPIRLISRLYSPEPAEPATVGLTERQRQVLACLYSCHHDGYVRERWMDGIRGDEPWLPVFVLRLVGEYVEPIRQRALANIDAIPRERYTEFAAENPAFMSLTMDRIVSRHRYLLGFRRDFAANPAYRFMVELDLWHGPQARRWIALAGRSHSYQAQGDSPP
jgi:hypothetical protein